MNYRGQSLSFQVIAIDMNAPTAKLSQPGDADDNVVPKEQDNSTPDQDITASTSSVVPVR